MGDLEEERPSNEVVKPTPKEGDKLTQPEEKPTVRSYNQRELDEAVGKGLASTNTQLSLAKAATESAKADIEVHKSSVEAIEAELQDLHRTHDELVSTQFASDPDARQAYVDKRGIAEDRRKLSKEKADVAKRSEVAAIDAMSALLLRKAIELSKETGIDVAELDNLDEVSMVEKALRFQITKEPKEPEKKEESKFDSLVSSGVGVDFSKLSADDKLKRGFRQLKK